MKKQEKQNEDNLYLFYFIASKGNNIDTNLNSKKHKSFYDKIKSIELKDWLTSCTILIAAITLSINSSANFAKTKWERTKFFSDEISLITSKSDNKLAIDFFRFGTATLMLFPDKSDSAKWVTITEDMLIQSIEVDSVRKDYTESEVRVRSILDVFFNDISIFNRYIEEGLITKNQAEPYLNSLKILNYKRKSTKFQNCLNNYLKYYNYTDVIDLLKKYDQ